MMSNDKTHQKEFLSITALHKITMINIYKNSTTYLKKIDHTQNTRHKISGKYQVKPFLNDYGKNTLACLVPTIFNEIPAEIIDLKNTTLQKSKLKEYLTQ